MDQSIRLRRPEEVADLFEADPVPLLGNSSTTAPDPNYGRRRQGTTKIVKRNGRLQRAPIQPEAERGDH